MAENHVNDMMENVTLMRYEIKVHYCNLKTIASKYMQGINNQNLSTQDIATLKYSVAKIRELTQKINVTEQMSSALHKLNCEKTLIDSERKMLKQITPMLKHIRKERKQSVGKTFEKQVDKFLDSDNQEYPVINYLKEVANPTNSYIEPENSFNFDDILQIVNTEDKTLHDFLNEMHTNNLVSQLPNVPSVQHVENNSISQNNCDKLT